jgi:hypothetical protein
MLAFALLSKFIEDRRAVGHEARRFADWGAKVAAESYRCPILALVTVGSRNSRIAHHPLDDAKLPRSCPSGMFVDEVPIVVHLDMVQLDQEPQMNH